MRYNIKNERKGNFNNKKLYVAMGIYTLALILGIIKESPEKKEDEIRISSSIVEKREASSRFGEKVLLTNYDQMIAYGFAENEPVNTKSLIDNSHFIKTEKRFFDRLEADDPNRELTREEKLAIILEMHDITEFQYYQMVSVLANEGGPENYDECYDVMCAAWNRTLSKDWCHDCEKYRNVDGTKVYNQLTWKAQFSGFLPNKAGYDRAEYEETMADEAALDFLYTLERSHNYCSFGAPWWEGTPTSAVQLNPECKGNKYYYRLKESDLNEKAQELDVDLEETFSR